MATHLGFTYHSTENCVQIYRDGSLVTTLRGRSAIHFTARAAEMNHQQQQQLMARETGNYKRGNEKSAKSKHQNKYR
ncbi:hypothetical protein ACPUEJ_16830 [Vibrio tubiashii]|uniref:hypothetical protein n=1 Tax=Vibrio tubiashii TaxID=29498 RepID=UPI003CE50F61